jgi:hypothetical protein
VGQDVGPEFKPQYQKKKKNHITWGWQVEENGKLLFYGDRISV